MPFTVPIRRWTLWRGAGPADLERVALLWFRSAEVAEEINRRLTHMRDIGDARLPRVGDVLFVTEDVEEWTIKDELDTASLALDVPELIRRAAARG